MELKSIIAKNIISLRQTTGMTQSELAEKLNYSDKAVSKWERGESLPDIAVLKNISLLFGVSLDWLTEEEHESFSAAVEDVEAKQKRKHTNRVAVTSMSILLVWLIATAVFVILQAVPAITRLHWLSFVYAMPVSAIVWLVFNSTWFNVRRNYPIVSLLMWTLIAALYINLKLCGISIWQLFLIGIPGQIIIIMWSALRFRKKK
ncbi:MAG: helix-turn-helix transcriptional regulator [Clostridia bacterium]|jgi:transcriptional regulator with XRE-family HTH domain|nr:helix-turn-helix transcriptional regulator [Clostridia bacterium]